MTAMTPPVPLWSSRLMGSITALREAAYEYQASVTLADAGAWAVQWDRPRPAGGTIGVAGRDLAAPPLRPHSRALQRIAQTWAQARQVLLPRYTDAALAYAYGATWAARRVLDGQTPDQVEFPARDVPGQLPPLGGEDLRPWRGVEEYLAARRALQEVPGHGGEHRALADAALAYGHQAQSALVYVLTRAVRTTPKTASPPGDSLPSVPPPAARPPQTVPATGQPWETP